MLSFLYGSTLTSIHDSWKNHSFDYTIFVGKVMSLLFNMLSRYMKESNLKCLQDGGFMCLVVASLQWASTREWELRKKLGSLASHGMGDRAHSKVTQ